MRAGLCGAQGLGQTQLQAGRLGALRPAGARWRRQSRWGCGRCWGNQSLAADAFSFLQCANASSKGPSALPCALPRPSPTCRAAVPQRDVPQAAARRGEAWRGEQPRVAHRRIPGAGHRCVKFGWGMLRALWSRPLVWHGSAPPWHTCALTQRPRRVPSASYQSISPACCPCLWCSPRHAAAGAQHRGRVCPMGASPQRRLCGQWGGWRRRGRRQRWHHGPGGRYALVTRHPVWLRHLSSLLAPGLPASPAVPPPNRSI